LSASAWALSLRAPMYRQKGPESAPIAVLEYSDFMCPQCAKVQPALKAFLEKHKPYASLVFKHNPLRMHKWAQLAAGAAECAGFQNRFWDYHDLLFARQKEWSESQDPRPLFTQYARQLKLDAKRFAQDFESGRWEPLIQRDLTDAASMGVHSTPTFFINRHRVVGASQLAASGDKFMEEEKAALKAPARR
jgi:protein-disulfide isomerase